MNKGYHAFELSGDQPIPAQSRALVHTAELTWAVNYGKRLRNRFGLNVWVDGTVTTGFDLIVSDGDFERAKSMFSQVL